LVFSKEPDIGKIGERFKRIGAVAIQENLKKLGFGSWLGVVY